MMSLELILKVEENKFQWALSPSISARYYSSTVFQHVHSTMMQYLMANILADTAAKVKDAKWLRAAVNAQTYTLITHAAAIMGLHNNIQRDSENVRPFHQSTS